MENISNSRVLAYAFSELLEVEIPQQTIHLNIEDADLTVFLGNSELPEFDSSVSSEVKEQFARLLEDKINKFYDPQDTLNFAFKTFTESYISIDDICEELTEIGEQSPAAMLTATFFENLRDSSKIDGDLEILHKEFELIGTIHEHISDELTTLLEQLPWNPIGNYVFPEGTFLKVTYEGGRRKFEFSDNILERLR